MRRFTKAQILILCVTALYVLGFTAYYTRSLNYEFVAYAGLVLVIFAVLYATLHLTRFPTYILAALSLWGLLHMLGGSLQTVDGVFYAYRIVPIFDGGGEFYVLKVDQVVHAFLYGVVALMFLHLLRNVAGLRTHTILVAATAVFASAGFSIINEIIEFTAVVVLPETGVGGYYNTVLDMIFNLGGAAVAVTGYWVLQYLKMHR